MIRWPNVFALLLIVVAIALIATQGDSLAAILGTATHVTPCYPPEEQVKGLLTVGLLGVILVCLARIVMRNLDKGDKS